MNQGTINKMTNRQNSSRRALMQSIYEKGFALDEMILFLDTHPNDRAALDYYHKLADECHELHKIYTMNYGPLFAKDVKDENFFTWVNKPMPWEGDK